MKKTLLFLSFLSSLLCFAQSDTLNRIDSVGKKQGYWIVTGVMKNDASYKPNAKVEEGNYLNNLKTGLWIIYYPSGAKNVELNYVNNRPNGHCTTFYEDGKKHEEGTWLGTRWSGDYLMYNDSGNVVHQFRYDTLRRRDGLQSYGEGWMGRKAIEVSMHDPDSINQTDSIGRKQGYWINTGKMKNDKSFADTAKVEEGIYLDNKKDGVWITYYPSGVVHSSIPYVNGKSDGYSYEYFENGHLYQEGYWKKNRWRGEYRMYYQTDTLREHFYYDTTGRREGMQFYFYPNGNLMTSSSVKDGKEYGWKMEYDQNGTLRRKTFYNAGVIDASKSWEKPGPTLEQYNDLIPLPKPDSPFRENNWIENGNSILYRDGQISMKGIFKNYKLLDGEERIYDENGNLAQIRLYKDGKYVGDGPIPADVSQ